MRNLLRSLAVLLTCSILTGCEEEPGPPPPPTKSAASVKTADTESSVDDGGSASERRAYNGLKFLIPSGWQEVPLSQMQMGILAAKFTMPEAGPDVVLTLSRSGGSLEDNLNRWKGQFKSTRPENVDTQSIAGMQATVIDLEGGFSPGMGRPDISAARMLGVIVPMEGQGYFIKLTGPVDQINRVEDDFRDFLKSAVKE